MKIKHHIFNFKLYYLFYLGAVGAFMPYVNVYLEKTQNLSGSQIGLISSLALVFGVCFIPLWGIIGDKTQKYTLLVQTSIVGSIISLYFYRSATVYLAIIISAIFLEIFRIGTIPMGDTVISDYTTKHRQNYGAIRSMGSLGYMLASTLVGFLSDSIGLDGPLFATYFILLGFTLSTTFFFPKVSTNHDKDNHEVKFSSLFKNKPFIFILIFILLTSSVNDASLLFVGNHLTSTLGASPSIISWYTIFAVLPEIAYLLFASTIIKRIGFQKFFIFSIIAIIFRHFIYAFIPSISLFMIFSTLHSFSVGISTVGALAFINKVVPPYLLGTAITLLNASMSIGKAIMGYINGYLYEYISSYAIFQVVIIFLLIALFLAIKNSYFKEIDENY